jgi:hypothetical protein
VRDGLCVTFVCVCVCVCVCVPFVLLSAGSSLIPSVGSSLIPSVGSFSSPFLLHSSLDCRSVTLFIFASTVSPLTPRHHPRPLGLDRAERITQQIGSPPAATARCTLSPVSVHTNNRVQRRRTVPMRTTTGRCCMVRMPWPMTLRWSMQTHMCLAKLACEPRRRYRMWRWREAHVTARLACEPRRRYRMWRRREAPVTHHRLELLSRWASARNPAHVLHPHSSPLRHPCRTTCSCEERSVS